MTNEEKDMFGPRPKTAVNLVPLSPEKEKPSARFAITNFYKYCKF
jgi:hypothetical protein